MYWCPADLVLNKPHRKKSGVEKTGTANTYLHMLHLYAVPEFPEGTIYQQDGAPPHFDNIAYTFLDEQFPARWIRRGS